MRIVKNHTATIKKNALYQLYKKFAQTASLHKLLPSATESDFVHCTQKMHPLKGGV